MVVEKISSSMQASSSLSSPSINELFHQMLGQLQHSNIQTQSSDQNSIESNTRQYHDTGKSIVTNGNALFAIDSLMPSFSHDFSLNTEKLLPHIHNINDRRQCIHCGKCYSNGSNLRQYIRNIHT